MNQDRVDKDQDITVQVIFGNDAALRFSRLNNFRNPVLIK